MRKMFIPHCPCSPTLDQTLSTSLMTYHIMGPITTPAKTFKELRHSGIEKKEVSS